MRKIMLLLMFVLIAISTSAQTTIFYTYDAAGNRTGRRLSPEISLNQNRYNLSSNEKIAPKKPTRSYKFSNRNRYRKKAKENKKQINIV